MVNTMTRNETAAWLSDRDRFCILTHTRPDGDTIGSASALCLGLRQLGKTAYLLENDGVSPFLRDCMDGLTKPHADAGDTLVSVDVASPGMLPENGRELLGSIALRIDHHASATSFTPVELVDSTASASADLVYDLLTALGVELTQAMARRLYIAVSTDTGCFRYANTNAHSYQVAAACAATGADLYPIPQTLFDTNTRGKLKLQSGKVENARFIREGRAPNCAIPKELEETVTKEDLENVPGFLRSIAGVKICASIRQTPMGSKMSVRAVPGYDAAAICAAFGGGGHKGAAGASLNLPPEEALQVVARMLEEYVDKIQSEQGEA